MRAKSFRIARLTLGLTCNELARLFGVSVNTIHQLENGHARAPQPTLRLLLAYLDGYRPKDWPDDLKWFMLFMDIFVTAQNAINQASYDLYNVLYILYIIIILLLLYIYMTLFPLPPHTYLIPTPIYRGGKNKCHKCQIPSNDGRYKRHWKPMP